MKKTAPDDDPDAPRPLVVFVDHSGLPGGGQLGLLRYLRQTSAIRPQVLQLGAGDTFARGLPRDVPVHVLSTSSRKWSYFLLLRRLNTTIKKIRPDIVVANSAKAASLVALLPRRSRTHAVYYMRDDLNPLRNSRGKILFFSKVVLPRFQAYMANSRWTATTIPASVADRRVEIVYPISGVTPRSAPMPHEGALHIVMLSRLDRWKAQHVLLDAVKTLEERGYGARLAVTIAGGTAHADPQYANELHTAARTLQTQVDFVGHLDDVNALLASADCLVAASLTPEPFGQVVVQGMGTGLAVIASNEGGPAEIIEDGVDGILVPPGDSVALAEAISMLLERPGRLSEIRKNALTTAARFEDDQTVPQLDQALAQFIHSFRMTGTATTTEHGSGMKTKLRATARALRTRYWTWRARRQLGAHGQRLTVNGRSSFTGRTSVGSNAHFNGMSVHGSGTVEIGDNFHSGAECMIISEIHNYRGTALPYDDTYVARPVRIGKNVWLGNRVIILGGVTIGDGAIIQAGSVVVSDIPRLGIAGGHPAKVFSQRDPDHYERLENAHAYH